jgi:hypothetical protein
VGEDAWCLQHIVTLDNHYLEYGQGVMIAARAARAMACARKLSPIGLKEIPACGSNADVLAYHGSIRRHAGSSREPGHQEQH